MKYIILTVLFLIVEIVIFFFKARIYSEIKDNWHFERRDYIMKHFSEFYIRVMTVIIIGVLI
jgi:hypothetical protein